MKDFNTIQEQLAQPFAAQDLEWRLQYATPDKKRGLAVPYVTSRAIMDRLDAVVGAENWRNEFQPWHGTGKKEAQICGISIWEENRKEWITKWDGAENTDIESVKGGLSDSMKRAAVQWGIGRVMYRMPAIWVNVQPRGNSFCIPDEERPRLDAAYQEAIKRMNLIPAAPGGLQSQLIGTPGYGDGQQNVSRQGGASAGQVNPAGQNRTTDTRNGAVAGQGNPARTFTILSYKVNHGEDRDTTSFQLRDNSSGEVISVFLGFVDQRLVPNVVLGSVKITPRTQKTVNYLVLEKYEVLPPMSNAA